MVDTMSTTTAITENRETMRVDIVPGPISPTLSSKLTSPSIDPKDPEGFLRRCSGYNKKKGVRCSATIGKNSGCIKSSDATFLPTCYAHKDQQSRAGRCQFIHNNGDKCEKLFRWTPPYFELCSAHQDNVQAPCFLLKLPLELRLEIFRYLLPSRPLGSSTSLLHIDDEQYQQDDPWYSSSTPNPWSRTPLVFHTLVGGRPSQHVESDFRTSSRSSFPTPFLDLLLVNRRIHDEVKDYLYSTVPFTIDVRKDGTFMCGRRLLEPRRADGTSHYVVDDVDKIKEKFLKTFDWAAVKNYNIDVLVENWKDDSNRGYHTFPWDEEVEIYDIRDYIGVVVSGILSKARNLCKLNVRLSFSKFSWTETELLDNIKTLVGPFERLRNVRQPRFQGVYEGTPQTNFMISLPLPCKLTKYLAPGPSTQAARPPTPLCSVPTLPTKSLLNICGLNAFQEYRSAWERRLSSPATTSLVRKQPIRAMFTALKEFYTRLAATVPDVTARNGRFAFLHRARVAREQEDVEAFRQLRNELIGFWEAYLELEERKKDDMNRRLSKMLDTDVYPSAFDEDHACIIGARPNAMFPTPAQSPLYTTEPWNNTSIHSGDYDMDDEMQRDQPCAQAKFTQSLPQHRNEVQALESSADNSPHSLSVQAPTSLITDLSPHSEQHQPRRDTRTQTGSQSTADRQDNTILCSPVIPAEQGATASPSQSRSQEPMALNPQVHLEAAMLHRRRVEVQIQQARAMQQMAQMQLTQEMQRQQQRQSELQREACLQRGRDQPRAQPRQQAMVVPTMRAQQIPLTKAQQVHLRMLEVEKQPFSMHSPPDSSSELFDIRYPQAAASMPTWNEQLKVGADQFDSAHAFKPILAPKPTSSTGSNPFYSPPDEASLKRASSYVEDAEDAADGKRSRVDSGMGWGAEQHREINENGDEVMVIKEEFEQPLMRTGNDWIEEPKLVGKGKMRAVEPEAVWVS